ncbi:MAG TPA: hypothetical protein VLT35_05615, partial [Methanocella sp.]|nr:hypothetical protein [Methanocella sp.]
MYLFTGSLRSGQASVAAACEDLRRDFPAVVARAVVVGVRLPGPVRRVDARFGGRLNGYAMCLNHWLRFLPVPVVLLNAEWLDDGGRLRERYRHDVATGYHPDCGCPF